MNNPVIKQALDYEAYFNSNDELRREYLAREEALLDEKIRHGYSHQRGIQEGIQSERKTIAINLLKANMSIDFISQNTGLSEQEILLLKKSLNK